MNTDHSLLYYDHMFNFRFDFRSEINGTGSDMTGFCRFFDISGRKSEPEVENVMFDVQLMII